MEIVEIDHAELDAIKVDILEKLPFIRIGLNSGLLEQALDIVNQLASSNPERWLDNVSTTYQQICERASESIPQVTPYMHRSELIWAYICIMSFYLYAYDDVWRNHVLAKMESKLRHPRLKQEIQEAKQLIETEFEKYQAFMRDLNASQLQPPKEVDDNKNSKLETQLAKKDEEIAQLKARVTELEARIKELEADQEPTATQGAGRPRQMLFESSEIEDEQKEKVLALLKEHKLAERYVNCTKDNPLNQYLESIYWRWQEIGIVREDTVLPTAFYHFLHDKCKLKFEITQKSFTNIMGKILCHKERYPEIWMLVREFFPKMEA